MADEDDGLPVRHVLDGPADVSCGDVIGAHRLHDEADFGRAAAHRGDVERQRLLLEAELACDLVDSAVEIIAAHGVRLEVVGLAADDLDEAFALRTNLDAGLVEVDGLDARGPCSVILAAPPKAAVWPKETRNQRGVGARLAEAQVRVLAHGNVCASDERPSA